MSTSETLRYIKNLIYNFFCNHYNLLRKDSKIKDFQRNVFVTISNFLNIYNDIHTYIYTQCKADKKYD